VARIVQISNIIMTNRRLNVIRRRVGLLLVAALILPLWSPQARCQQKVGTYAGRFLNLVNSARANGMGACAIDLVDEESGLYNPGGVGLFHLDKTIAVAWPQSTKWLPTLNSGERLKSYTLSAGMSSQRLHWGKDPLLNISLAFAFSRLELDDNSLGDPMFRLRDRADCYTVAIGVDYLIRAGIGFTYKRVTEDVTASWYPYGSNYGFSSSFVANGRDVGITVELPLWRVWHLKHPQKALEPPPAVRIMPRCTYVIANRGTGCLRGSGNDPVSESDISLSGVSRKSLSIHASYTKNDLALVSVILAGEIEKERFDGDKIQKRGVELGIFEMVYGRVGNLKDDRLGGSDTDINTLGLGFSLNGLIKYTRIIEHLHPSPRLRWLLANLEVRFDYARYGGDEDQSFSAYNTKFYKLTISL
jgi:hypothetical protein